GQENSSFTSDHMSAGAGVNFGADGIGFTANFAMGENDLDRTQTTSLHSQVNATGNLHISSGNDTSIVGANLHATDLSLDVGNDLTVASIQDVGHVEGQQWDVSVSVTVGAGFSANASVGYGETEGSSAWVDQQTSLIGSNSVNINVGGHTQVD